MIFFQDIFLLTQCGPSREILIFSFPGAAYTYLGKAYCILLRYQKRFNNLYWIGKRQIHEKSHKDQLKFQNKCTQPFPFLYLCRNLMTSSNMKDRGQLHEQWTLSIFKELFLDKPWKLKERERAGKPNSFLVLAVSPVFSSDRDKQGVSLLETTGNWKYQRVSRILQFC